jgi:hypothetical protein
MNEMEIIKDYKSSVTISDISEKYKCTIGYVIKVIHYHMIGKNQEIIKIKELI